MSDKINLSSRLWRICAGLALLFLLISILYVGVTVIDALNQGVVV